MTRPAFPNYPAADADGYPAARRREPPACDVLGELPDYYETFRPKLDNPNDPTVAGKEPGPSWPTSATRNVPARCFASATCRSMVNASVHSGEDVVLTARGPGSERVRGQIDNTEVFRVMVEALGLGNGE